MTVKKFSKLLFIRFFSLSQFAMTTIFLTRSQYNLKLNPKSSLVKSDADINLLVQNCENSRINPNLLKFLCEPLHQSFVGMLQGLAKSCVD